MLHPSYAELIKVVNGDVEEGDTPVVNSRYSIVLATAKRARQLIDGAKSDCAAPGKKPLSTAVEEMALGKLKVLGEDEEGDKADEEAALAAVLASDIPSVDLQTDEVPMGSWKKRNKEVRRRALAVKSKGSFLPSAVDFFLEK